jgi:TetR/AcrR family transcriptional regulator, transcriptional repressor for nem operon
VPYPAGHRIEVKRKIVDSARKLFNRHGFDNVSVSQIMAGAGLTHGGFYSYFKSKNDLYTEVLGCFFTDPNWKNCWEGVDVDLSSTDAGPQVVLAYLSRQHFEDVENSCPMVALPSDVARGGKSSKRAFQTVFKAMVSVLERSLIENRQSRRVVSQATAALCVGGMVVGRALADRSTANELRDACMSVALQLGGWDKRDNRNNGKPKVSRQTTMSSQTHAGNARN